MKQQTESRIQSGRTGCATAAYLGNAGRVLAVDIGASAINRQMGM